MSDNNTTPQNEEPIVVSLQSSSATPVPDLARWMQIRQSSRATSFNIYKEVMDALLYTDILWGDKPPSSQSESVGNLQNLLTPLEGETKPNTVPNPIRTNTANRLLNDVQNLRQHRYLPFNDTDAYRLLKVATEAFLLARVGVTELGEDEFAPTSTAVTEAAHRLRMEPQTISDAVSKGVLTNNDTYLTRVDNDGHQEWIIPYLDLVRSKLGDMGVMSRLKRQTAVKMIVNRDQAQAGTTQTQPQDSQTDEPWRWFQDKLSAYPLLELIWSYWHEEGMLVQTMNAISRRFQNIHGPGERDPLANFETAPLYTHRLPNLLWGYIQDEQHQLSLVRRAYEYDHHYGLSLYGKAIPQFRPADSRSKFLEAFHTLLYLCNVFFQQDDETTVKADGFPVLNALRDVHLVLTEGQHNQFGDLPSTARQEMLIQQWLLARPEFREFLPTRAMVAYPEPWMDRVDAMKSLQGWTDTSVLHFSELAQCGEQILLSVRFGNWSDWRKVGDPIQAVNWARFWRPEIQRYIYAYRAVTGVDLTADITGVQQARQRYLLPSEHLRRQLASKQRTPRTTATAAALPRPAAPKRKRALPPAAPRSRAVPRAANGRSVPVKADGQPVSPRR